MQFVLHSLLRENSMYRQQLSRENMVNEDEQFLTSVGSLPIVNSAWTQVSDIYTKTKEHNTLFNYTLGIAESSVKKVVTTAQPLAEKYDGPIKYVNAVACNQLNHLKESYPVIVKPTDQVIQDGKEKCTAIIQPAVNKISAVKDFGVNAYTKSYETVNGVAQSVTDQLTKVTNQALQTSYGQVVNTKVNGMLIMSEEYLDKYLPSSDTDSKEHLEKSENALVRAGHVSTKLRRRMYSRAMKNLQNVKVRSTETLAKLHFTVDLIEYAKSNLGGAKTRVQETVGAAQSKLWDTWNEINKEELEAGGEKDGDSQNLEKRGIAVARFLIKNLKSNLNSLESIIVEMPGTLQDKYHGIQAYTDELRMSFKEINSVNEVPTWMINQTKNRLSYLQEMLAFLTEQAINNLPLGWMEMDVNLDGLNLEEIEHMWTHEGQIVPVSSRLRGNQDG